MTMRWRNKMSFSQNAIFPREILCRHADRINKAHWIIPSVIHERFMAKYIKIQETLICHKSIKLPYSLDPTCKLFSLVQSASSWPLRRTRHHTDRTQSQTNINDASVCAWFPVPSRGASTLRAKKYLVAQLRQLENINAITLLCCSNK